MQSNQAHPAKSTPSAVKMNAGFKTNVPLDSSRKSPSSRLKPIIYPVRAALSGNGLN